MNKTAVELLRTNASYIDALRRPSTAGRSPTTQKRNATYSPPLVRSALTYITVTGSSASCRRKHR